MPRVRQLPRVWQVTMILLIACLIASMVIAVVKLA
jgi:hypothetical protein